MRPLASTDYKRNHFAVLSVLSVANDPGSAAYLAQFQTLLSIPNTYFTIVIIDKSTDMIVGVGCVFMERKFLRNLGVVGHIEDIAVEKKVQGAKLGLRIIQALTAISESRGAYKTILNCSTDNIRESHSVAITSLWVIFWQREIEYITPCSSILPKMRLRAEVS
jgi:glucosamine-phosphate N-acetyltransferase